MTEREGCQGKPCLQIVLLCLLFVLWKRRFHKVSEIEMGGGKHRVQRIEELWPAPSSQSTLPRVTQPFVSQDNFRDRTMIEKVHRDDALSAMGYRAGPAKD